MPRTFAALAIFFLVAVSLGVSHPSQASFFGGKYDSVKAVNGEVRIPLAQVSDFKAHYYSYDAPGGTVKFFVLKSKDGVVRAAFDACDVCWPQHKGYTQDGDYMVCNNCGQKFHSSKINDVTGGCNPAALTRAIGANNLVIRTADLAAGLKYFK